MGRKHCPGLSHRVSLSSRRKKRGGAWCWAPRIVVWLSALSSRLKKTATGHLKGKLGHGAPPCWSTLSERPGRTVRPGWVLPKQAPGDRYSPATSPKLGPRVACTTGLHVSPFAMRRQSLDQLLSCSSPRTVRLAQAGGPLLANTDEGEGIEAPTG
jgi:hypothetical protein